jgi:flagellar basal body-associated protein FliL
VTYPPPLEGEGDTGGEGERKMELSLFARIVIIVTVVISATDAITFWHIRKHGKQMKDITWPFVIAVIIITIIPIVVNLWYHLIFKP